MIRLTILLVALCGTVPLRAATSAYPAALVQEEITQQTDPKKAREVTASVDRSSVNETVTLNATFPDDASPVRVSLYNILGKLIEVHPTSSVPKGENQFRFLTKGLPSGPYIVVLECSGQRIVNKVMVSR